MRIMLLGLAAGIAALAVTTPAAAGTPDEAFVGIPNAKGTVGTLGFGTGGGFHGGIGHPGFGHPGFGFGFDDGRFDRRRRRGDVDVSVGTWVNGGEWALYNNRSFESDSYNDWWHDQPWRSQPAWVRNNRDCRRYWSGGGWRC
jgi:hypothetical protein